MKPVLFSLLCFALCLVSPLSRAASDYYLEIDGIKGEAQDPVRPDTIPIDSFSWGVSNTTTGGGGGGGGAGKVSMQDFHLTMKLSKATPKLLLACATGQHIRSAKLFVRKRGGDGSVNEYYVITLSDILVSSVTQSGPGSTGGDSLPVDQISLSFSKVMVSYSEADGTATTVEIDQSAGTAN